MAVHKDMAGHMDTVVRTDMAGHRSIGTAADIGVSLFGRGAFLDH
jgi:hypothetical protein